MTLYYKLLKYNPVLLWIKKYSIYMLYLKNGDNFEIFEARPLTEKLLY